MNMNVDNTTILIFLGVLFLYVFLEKAKRDINEAQKNRIEKFNVNEYSTAMRSFGRTSNLNETVFNAECNPHGEYYVMRYTLPTFKQAKCSKPKYPMSLGYYDSCGNEYE